MNRERAEEIIKLALDLMERKNADYGSENIVQTGLFGLAVRLTDKVFRLRNLTQPNGHAPNFEGIGDTFADVMNYGLIGIMLQEGSWSGAVPSLPDYFDTTGDLPLAYLAGSIDAVSVEEAVGWRHRAEVDLTELGLTTFNPAAPYGFDKAGTMPKQAMRYINRAAIDVCRFVLVNYDGKGFGTIREIEYARNIGKPVVVFGDKASQLHNHVEALDLIIEDSYLHAIEHIVTLLSP